MKLFLALLLFAHGFIHLLGFAKAFNLSRIENIKKDIPKPMGVLWFLAFLVFIYSGEASITESNTWYVVALAGVVLSVGLIIPVWSDAKFGIFPNLLVLAIALVTLFSVRFDRMVLREKDMLLCEANTIGYYGYADRVERLPYPVRNWLRQSGALDRGAVKTVRVKQRAGMKLRPGQSGWLRAEAEQLFTLEKPAFIWKVNVQIYPIIDIDASDLSEMRQPVISVGSNGMSDTAFIGRILVFPSFISLTGRDMLYNGKGVMLIKLFSMFNLVNESGPKIDEAALQRFLAEIVWFPSAALRDYISWRGIDSLSADAAIVYNDTRATGRFFFNEKGEFVRFETYRYKDNTPDSERIRWTVLARKYARMDGVRVPILLDVYWDIEGKPWRWLMLNVTGLRYENDADNFNVKPE